jgi:hypothetical protein
MVIHIVSTEPEPPVQIGSSPTATVSHILRPKK